MSGELTLYSQGSLKKSGLTQLSNFVCWGWGSLCRRHNLSLDNNIGKAVPRYIFWAPNSLDELLEVRFKFPFVLIGKSAMAFLTGQSLGTYTCTQNPGTQVAASNKDFSAVSQMDLTRV